MHRSTSVLSIENTVQSVKDAFIDDSGFLRVLMEERIVHAWWNHSEEVLLKYSVSELFEKGLEFLTAFEDDENVCVVVRLRERFGDGFRNRTVMRKLFARDLYRLSMKKLKDCIGHIVVGKIYRKCTDSFNEGRIKL